MKASNKIARRKFLQLTGISGAGLALGYTFIAGKAPAIVHTEAGDNSLASEVNPYIFIDDKGKITIYNQRPEMGQGTFTAIPMIIAEELEVNMENITIMPSPANSEKYGDQAVYGSRSIMENYELMRKVGASAKEMFITAAAAKWNIDTAQCYAADGNVINRNTAARLSYGALVTDAKKLSPPSDPKLKDPKDFKIIGTPVPRKDLDVKINGAAQFGIDIKVPGMLYASVEHSPVFLAKLVSFDDAKAKAVPGVKYVLKTQREVFGNIREGVAVIADNYWAATQGRKLLDIKWDNAGNEKWNTQNIKEDYLKASQQKGESFDTRGDAAAAINNAAIKVEVIYETPYQAHAPMEPMNVVVSVEKDTCSFWGSTQNPNGMRSFLAEKLGIKEENVAINYTFMGGAFGRRSMTDVVEEAAILSKKVGAPIKIIWSREDDITQGPFRACSLNVCRGAVDNNGNIIALEHKVICQEIQNQSGNDMKPSGATTEAVNTDYAIPNVTVSAVLRKLPVPVFYWRSVYNSTNCFAHESFIDELAYAAKKDPLDLRLSLLKDHKQYTQVLQTVAERSNWYQPREKDTGKGVAIGERSGAFVAMVVEVKNTNGKVKPVKVSVAIDCGTAVNPAIITEQVEGCVVMGLQAAYQSITIQNGKAAEQNFDTYKMLRINECPDISVHIISSTAAPQGAGESALPNVAPALCNAIFDLTKKRIRVLPLNLDEV
ncbi:xanthine dehydrogenase family protein molybdopterin-binding subunit [Panacibacter ginsenosidivorans]|uniref:Xanthine dehydrogenase family protein molybdopterin-binding subunit n=1 Tax=Panacibacter ginsenosidivorans TaxID=1813871 RepID=A0A5B8V8D8_9BACT|nr:molybdopterin cofactor-binding domain-containing protein [Panacibacter ginsenosidivorans]QEC66976.1 xanthine dehydrogenase family protein molybdopterin-binding subunit [Panacibacter ginsenosidivorans]